MVAAAQDDDGAFSQAIASVNYNCLVMVEEDFKIFFFLADKTEKRHKLFYTWANTSFMPEPDAPGGQVKYVLYRDQCDKFGMKKKFSKNFRVEITLEDRDVSGAIIDRVPKEDDVHEILFREQKRSFDQWVTDDLTATRQGYAWTVRPPLFVLRVACTALY